MLYGAYVLPEDCDLSLCMLAGTDEAAKLKAKKKRGRTAAGNSSKVCLLFSGIHVLDALAMTSAC